MTDMLLTPARGACLWTRADLQGAQAQWRRQWTEEELGDIDAALAQVKASGLGCGQFGAADFPLGSAGATLRACREEVVNGRGFAVIGGLPVDRYELAEIEAIYWGLGCHLGRAITQNDAGDILTHVTMDPTLGPGQPAQRGYQDRRYQEPHNDRADIVGLLCVRTARNGGSSSIVNATALYNDVLLNRPEFLAVLFRGFRIQQGPGRVSEVAAPVFNWFAGRLFVWFSSRNVERAMQSLPPGSFSEIEREAFDYLSAIALKPEYRLDMELQPGDIQLVNNYAVMHSRTAYEDHEEQHRWRLLLRLWLNAPELQLDPAFARYSRRTLYPGQAAARGS